MTQAPSTAAGITVPPRGIAQYDALVAQARAQSPWQLSGQAAAVPDHQASSTPLAGPAMQDARPRARYLPDLDLLARILSVPVRAQATTQSGLLGKGLDAWFAHEFRRAGFDPDAVWPRAQDPRVLPTDLAALLEGLPAPLRRELERRLGRMRSVAPQDARILGRAYTKQVDVVMSSWQTGPELMLSTTSQSGSFGHNLANRFEEAYGDAGNLRARYPLAAVGFAFVVSAAILAEPTQVDKAVDMMLKLRDRGDGNGYTTTTLICYEPLPGGKVRLRPEVFPSELGPGPFMEAMIDTILQAAPSTRHGRVRELRRHGTATLGS